LFDDVEENIFELLIFVNIFPFEFEVFVYFLLCWTALGWMW